MSDPKEKESTAYKLQVFLHWCKDNGMEFNEKVNVVSQGTSHRCGVLARQAIASGEILVKIPRKLLLSPKNGKIKKQLTQFRRDLKSNGKSLKNTSGWIPLILSLMYEYIDNNSFWRPYLDLVPLEDECCHPLFWSKEERKEELDGLTILEDVESDLTKMRREYKSYALDFINQYENEKEQYGKKFLDFNLYKQMVAFIMAYSFTEGSSGPSMVPMADIFNHRSENTAHLVYRRDNLQMVSTKEIKQGEEIFNTFGKLSNSQLLQMYGFTEADENPYDTVHMSLSQLLEVISQRRLSSPRLLRAKMICIIRMGIVNDTQDGFVFSTQGLMSGPDPLLTLEILHMKKRPFIKTYRRFLKDSLFLSLSCCKRKFKYLAQKNGTVRRATKKRRLASRSCIACTSGNTNCCEKTIYNDKHDPIDDNVNGSITEVITTGNTECIVDNSERTGLYENRTISNPCTLECNSSLKVSSIKNDRNDKSITDRMDLQGNHKEPMESENSIFQDNEDSDNSDDEVDSDLLFTFDQIRARFDREWIETICRCASSMQSKLKERRTMGEFTDRQIMARNLRRGQRHILKAISSSLDITVN